MTTLADQLYRLQELLVDGYSLVNTTATGCRCCSCWCYALVDSDYKSLVEADTVEELLAKLPAKDSPPVSG